MFFQRPQLTCPVHQQFSWIGPIAKSFLDTHSAVSQPINRRHSPKSLSARSSQSMAASAANHQQLGYVRLQDGVVLAHPTFIYVTSLHRDGFSIEESFRGSFGSITEPPSLHRPDGKTSGHSLSISYQQTARSDRWIFTIPIGAPILEFKTSTQLSIVHTFHCLRVHANQAYPLAPFLTSLYRYRRAIRWL